MTRPEPAVPNQAAEILRAYYDAFNRQDTAGMLALLDDAVVHEPSPGIPREGIARFREFLEHMNRSYRETVIDPVIMTSPDGSRAAAEFMLEGQYLVTDEGLPPANRQAYRLRVGAFFELRDNWITRVSNHYNMADWIRQVEAA